MNFPFDGDQAPVLPVACLVARRHTAATDLAIDLVAVRQGGPQPWDGIHQGSVHVPPAVRRAGPREEASRTLAPDRELSVSAGRSGAVTDRLSPGVVTLLYGSGPRLASVVRQLAILGGGAYRI